MSLPQHLEEAVIRLREADMRLKEARAKPATPESHQAWLMALSDYAVALCDVQEYNNESVHEKLHELAARLGLRHFPSAERQAGGRDQGSAQP